MQVQRRQVLIAAAGTALLPLSARAQTPPPAHVPFTLLNGKMFVEATVNGKPAQAFVDSGAQSSGVDEAFATAAGITGGKRVTLRGIQGKQRARLAGGLTIRLGRAETPGPVLVADYAPLAASVRHDIDAVIGGDIFRAWVVEIDFDGQTLAFHDRAGFSPPKAATPVPLASSGALMTAPVAIEGRDPIRAILDLGSNVPLIVSPKPARASGLLDGRRISTRRLGGHGPQTIARVTTTKTVTLAGQDFTGVPAMIPDKSIGADANIGLPVLQRFRLYLDFGGQRMWLGKASAGRNEPFDRNRTGIEADIDGDNLRIAHIARGSPAEAGGWKRGEVITHIDGEPAAAANLSLSLTAHPGQTLEFTLADGRKRKLTLADYY